MKKKIYSYFSRSPFSTLCVMACSFLGFGFFSFNIFFIFQANLSLIKNYGLMALVDGAGLQLLMIICNTFLSVCLYTIWKICERILVDWFTEKKN